MTKECEHEASLKFLFDGKMLCQHCFDKETCHNGHQLIKRVGLYCGFKTSVLDKYEVPN